MTGYLALRLRNADLSLLTACYATIAAGATCYVLALPKVSPSGPWGAPQPGHPRPDFLRLAPAGRALPGRVRGPPGGVAGGDARPSRPGAALCLAIGGAATAVAVWAAVAHPDHLPRVIQAHGLNDACGAAGWARRWWPATWCACWRCCGGSAENSLVDLWVGIYQAAQLADAALSIAAAPGVDLAFYGGCTLSALLGPSWRS